MARVKINHELIIKTNNVIRNESVFRIKPPKSILVKQMPSFSLEGFLVIIGSCLVLFFLIKFVSWQE